MGSLTPLTSLLPDSVVEFRPPSCRHGNEHGACEECQEAAREKEEREYREWKESQEKAKREREEATAKERREHPERWLANYNIPAKFREASFDNFSGGEQVKKICRMFPGVSILLSGKTGCGKTHLSVATLREMIKDDVIKGDAIFTTAPELLLDIRSCYSSNDDEKALVEKYSTPEILILDDLGADKATEWAITTLYLILDRRNKDLKATFVTTNLSLPEIEGQYGARIASRLADMKIVELKMPDWRKKRG